MPENLMWLAGMARDWSLPRLEEQYEYWQDRGEHGRAAVVYNEILRRLEDETCTGEMAEQKPHGMRRSSGSGPGSDCSEYMTTGRRAASMASRGRR